MLIISNAVSHAFLDKGIAQLREMILAGWRERLHAPATRIGEEGRNRILADIETMARDNPNLTDAQLVMFADIALAANAPIPPEAH